MSDILGGIGKLIGISGGAGGGGGGIGGLFGLADLGELAEKACDLIGLDPKIGDLVAVGVDAYTGNWLGVAQQAPDVFEDLTSGAPQEPPPTTSATPGFDPLLGLIQNLRG